MEALRSFLIPLRGLSDGHHRFEFKVGGSFFEHFEEEAAHAGEFDVILDLEKRSRLLVLDFDINGKESTSCDRCLNPIALPVDGEYRLYIKYGDDGEEDADVAFIPEGTDELDVSRFIFEFIILSLPMVKVYDCQDEKEPPCNFEVLEKLEVQEDETDIADDENNPWTELKKLTDLKKDKK